MSIERRGSIDQSITLNGEKKRAKRNIIYFCSAGEPLSDVISQKDFPVLGSEFPEVPGLYCSEIILHPERDGKKVKVTAECTYSERDGNGVNVVLGGMDYGKAFQFRVSPVETKVPFLFSYDTVDSEGHPTTPVCSSAGEFFNLETTAITMLLRFSYYIRSFEPEWILNLTDTTNRKAVRVCGIGIKEGCGLLRSISAETAENKGKTVIQVNIELEVNPSGFRRSVPNRGYFCLSDGVYTRICSGISQYTNTMYYAPLEKLISVRKEETPILPVDEPAWLDNTGKVRSSQTMMKKPPILTFQEKRSTDWSILSLPSGNPW